ncbi:MAG: VWA domain-containing protein [Marinifilaceae bacterium]|jgi:Ca-activated chloride channel family protein|nr:VWA domain-containing protein [Marinifilaceae bacterium]
MHGIEFHNPYYLLILLLVIPYVVWYVLKHKEKDASLKISSISPFSNIKSNSMMRYVPHVIFALRIVLIGILVLMLARPQSSIHWKKTNREGIDIVMAIDISSSMLAQDFKPNRLEAAKRVAQNFIKDREDDRIGLVVFAGESFTQCPLTTDHSVLINLFKDIKCGIVEDGTAIGLGLANAVNRLKDSKVKSKTIILLTDGMNNRGDISPETAADLAKTFGIRVYTIGVGTMGEAPYPMQTPFGIKMGKIPVEIDEAMLSKIALETGGKYFRAVDENSLVNIYKEIDKLEKTKIEEKSLSRKNEMYFGLGILALLIFGIEMILRFVVLKRIP